MLGDLIEFRRDPLAFLLRKQQDSGPVARLQLPRVAYLLNTPEDIGHVLAENHSNYVKGAGIQNGRQMLGQGLLSSEGALHRQQSRMMQPIFKRDHLLPLADTILATTRKRLTRWQPGSRIDIAAEMMRLSLLIGGQTLFSIDFDEEADGLADAYEVCQRHMVYKTFALAPVPAWVPTSRNREHQRAIGTLDETFFAIIRKRRHSPATHHDFLAHLLQARDEHGRPMSDRQLRDELVTLLLAAHETIGTVMSWFWYLLAGHPEVERKFRDELRAVFPAGDVDAAGAGRLEFTEMVLDETMRYYPPPWLIPRRALNHDTLPSGFAIPAGANVYLSPYAVQRNPAYFPDPERFDPERFRRERKNGRHRFAYFPFGGGARGCVGETFARMQGLLVLAAIGTRFKLTLVPGQTVKPEPVVTLRPMNGIWMELNHANESSNG